MSSSVVSIASVAFDAYVFAPVHSRDGIHLERGEDALGNVLAVGSVDLRAPIGAWIAFQSQRGANLLDIVEKVRPVGHKAFDDQFLVDTDDVSLVRDLFETAPREQLVEIDAAQGPLVIIFDPGEDDDARTTLFVARAAANDEAVAVTINVTQRVLDVFLASR